MSFQVSILAADAVSSPTSMLLVPVFEAAQLPEPLAKLDVAIGGAIAAAWASRDFSGKRDQVAIFYHGGPVSRVVLVGMGSEEEATVNAIRRAAMVAGRRAGSAGIATASLMVPVTSFDAARVGQALAEGLPFGAWEYRRYRRPADPVVPELESVTLIVPEIDQAFDSGVERGNAIAAGQTLTRELQVLPADTCTPTFLAEQAAGIAERNGMKLTVLNRAEIAAEGMGALMAVAKGSANEPKFIILEYSGAESSPVVLVGKGVTFDTGGISIKPAMNMEEMKYDMSGAAAVLGAMEAIGRLKPKQRVVALVPSAENMVSGTAYRPGDVVRSHHGKTIEVVNTDAEGRLLLADALSYARKFQPAAVIDCATLTGAVVLGLGHTASAVMGTSPELIGELVAAGEKADERLWELPMWNEYRELIKSDIADVKNSGGRPAGSITAGWFLREFVEGYPWAHLDIAGTAYTGSAAPTQVKGATGVLVRLFSEFVLARS